MMQVAGSRNRKEEEENKRDKATWWNNAADSIAADEPRRRQQPLRNRFSLRSGLREEENSEAVSPLPARHRCLCGSSTMNQGFDSPPTELQLHLSVLVDVHVKDI
ncbi:hypothetical protein U1Q18_052408 [Sarracenia purpurea var. burkii]